MHCNSCCLQPFQKNQFWGKLHRSQSLFFSFITNPAAKLDWLTKMKLLHPFQKKIYLEESERKVPYIQDICYTGSFIYLGDTLLNLIPNTLRHCAENFKSLPHLSCNGLSYTRWIVTSFRKVYFEKNANLKLHRYSHFRKKLHWWSESLLWRKWKIVKFCWCLSCRPMNCYILQTSLLWEKENLKLHRYSRFRKKSTLRKWKWKIVNFCWCLSYTQWIVTSFRKVYFEKNENLQLHCYSSFSKVFFGESESEKLWTSAGVCLKPDSNSTRLPQSRSRTTKRKKAAVRFCLLLNFVSNLF